MIYEFIATLAAGFGMAGIALIIRHLSKLSGFVAPKWLIPIFAGLGMLGFQIHQEYHWHEQQMKLLPENVQVVKTIEDTTWYRPWSYLKPQVKRFMAVNEGQTLVSDSPSSAQLIMHVNLYLFERRISTKIVPQLINCTQPASANITKGNDVSTINLYDIEWHKLDANDPLIKTACT